MTSERATPRKEMVYLVGAGPGDPWLLTLRAQYLLEQADVVLYDALVHPDILRHCRPDCEQVFAGKRARQPSARQEAINERLIQEAKAGKRVVRLKGGDPFLFGRGTEEASALAAANVDFEIVPGVTSPSAATAYAGVALTDRERSSSVAFVTASESPNRQEPHVDWSRLATATQTLVIFMGAQKLEALCAELVRNGRPLGTPVAVVQWASRANQRVVQGTLATIAEAAATAKLGSPSLTVVGDIVEMRRMLDWASRRPLFGKRVLVGRAPHQAEELTVLLRAKHAEPVEIPLIEITKLQSDRIDTLAANPSGWDWIVFTSSNSVEAFFGHLHAHQRDARALGTARICAIGPSTASKLQEQGIFADLVPEDFSGEEVASALLKAAGSGIAEAKILIPRAETAREVLPERLRTAGAAVEILPLYRTEHIAPESQGAAALRDLLRAKEIDVVTLTSSSMAEALHNIVQSEAGLLDSVTIASIGSVTTAAATKLGLHVAFTATPHTSKGLVLALEEHFTRLATTHTDDA